MKKRYLFIILIITFIVEIVITYNFLKTNESYKNDSVVINELVKNIENNNYINTKYKYTIFDNNENIIYQSNKNLSKNLTEAYVNRDTIVDVNINNRPHKLVISNELNKVINNNRKKYITIITIISIIQLITFIIYYILLYIYTIRPFKKMKEFASRVSSGNLDIPLAMDKNNNFGAFTEAFDIMRSEIKKARNDEKKAIEAKKELVAKLSHDIKSPIASIKSSSEIGIEVSKEDNSKKYFKSINQKSDQINTLITNLFNSTLDEMEELKINPTKINSSIIKELISNSDYLNKNNQYNIKDCNVFADKLRLQQVFDNIYVNSYKYADTDIEVKSNIENNYLIINIKDFGTNIKKEEIPLLTEKFKRGSNVSDKDGVGLGLYISKEFMKKMNGELELDYDNGFIVIIKLRII